MRVCAKISENSRANSPREVKQIRSKAARADSPAVTDSAIISASAGNSATSCFSRLVTASPSHQSRARKPLKPLTSTSTRATRMEKRSCTTPMTVRALMTVTPARAHSSCSARNARTLCEEPARRRRSCTELSLSDEPLNDEDSERRSGAQNAEIASSRLGSRRSCSFNSDSRRVSPRNCDATRSENEILRVFSTDERIRPTPVANSRPKIRGRFTRKPSVHAATHQYAASDGTPPKK